MSIGRALAILGAGVGGYAQGAAKFQEDERRKEDAEWRKKVRDRQEQEWAITDEERAAVKEAAATRLVDDSMVVAPGGSRDAPRVEDQGVRVVAPGMVGVAGAPAFGADRAAAEAAAAEANKLPNRMQRVAGALVGRNPERAARISADVTAGKLSQIQLDQAMQAQADEAFNRDLSERVQFGDWAAAAKFMTQSKGDKNDGNTKFSFDLSPDGTKMVLSKSADGKNWSVMGEYGNDTAGFMKWASGGMRLPTSQKFAHLAAAAKTEDEAARWKEQHALAVKAEDRRAAHEKRMEDQARAQTKLAGERLGIERDKAKTITDGMSKIELMNFKTYADIVETNQRAIAKSLAEGNKIAPEDMAKMQATIAAAQTEMVKILSATDKSGKPSAAADIAERGGKPTTPPAPGAPAPPATPKPAASAPMAAAATSMGGIETTTSAGGAPMFRLVGSEQWYPSREEAERVAKTLMSAQRSRAATSDPTIFQN